MIAKITSTLLSIPWLIASANAIVNGTETHQHPAVKMITTHVGIISSMLCSSVQVGKGTLLTAGHCTLESEETGKFLKPEQITVHLEHSKIHIKTIHRLDGFVFHSSDNNIHIDASRDLAVLTFNEPSANFDFVSISKIPPQSGEKVTLVGFGRNDFNTNLLSSSGTKRFGNNFIQYAGNEFILIEGPRGAGTLATYGAGDSGGALFNQNGELIGTESNGHANHQVEQDSVFYLQGSLGKELLEKAKNLGADINYN